MTGSEKFLLLLGAGLAVAAVIFWKKTAPAGNPYATPGSRGTPHSGEAGTEIRYGILPDGTPYAFTTWADLPLASGTSRTPITTPIVMMKAVLN